MFLGTMSLIQEMRIQIVMNLGEDWMKLMSEVETNVLVLLYRDVKIPEAERNVLLE